MKTESITVRDLKRGDIIVRDGDRLVYHGYATRRGSKLWQLQLTHEAGNGLVLLHQFPDDTVGKVPTPSRAANQEGTK